MQTETLQPGIPDLQAMIGVAGDALRPAQAAFVCMDVPGKEEGVDGLVPAGLFREKVSHGTAAFEPVLCQDVKGRL